MSLQDPERLSQAVGAAVKLQIPRTHLRHTLRVKVLVLLVCSLALFLVILFFPIRQIFLNSFNDLEQQSMEVDLTRALNVINNAKPSNTFSTSQFKDSYLTWVNHSDPDLGNDGKEIRGADHLIPKGRKRIRESAAYAVRFHLAPGVEVTITADGMGAILRSGAAPPRWPTNT